MMEGVEEFFRAEDARSAEPKPKPKGLIVWDAGDDDEAIPPRGWLLGKTFCRGFISSILESSKELSSGSEIFEGITRAQFALVPDSWPEKIASKVNPACVEFLCLHHMAKDGGKGVKAGDWSTGIIVCDWVGLDNDWDLVRCVVGMNSKLIQ